MIKKMLTVFMVVLMLAGIFFSVANFTSSDLDAANIDINGRWQWVLNPYSGWHYECAWDWYDLDCIVGGQWLIIP